MGIKMLKAHSIGHSRWGNSHVYALWIQNIHVVAPCFPCLFLFRRLSPKPTVIGLRIKCPPPNLQRPPQKTFWIGIKSSVRFNFYVRWSMTSRIFSCVIIAKKWNPGVEFYNLWVTTSSYVTEANNPFLIIHKNTTQHPATRAPHFM